MDGSTWRSGWATASRKGGQVYEAGNWLFGGSLLYPRTLSHGSAHGRMHGTVGPRRGTARRGGIRLAVALVVLTAGGAAPASAAPRPSINAGVVLVGFRPGVSSPRRHAVERAAGAVQ